jgi:hypothetical protein
MQTLDPLRDFPSIRKTEPAGANRLTVKKFAAEFWGTFALVFAGTGAIVKCCRVRFLEREFHGN